MQEKNNCWFNERSKNHEKKQFCSNDLRYCKRGAVCTGHVHGSSPRMGTLIVWRKMEHKEPIKVNGRSVLFTIFAVLGALVLGLGMCFVMVWENIIVGTVIGLVGIIMLLALIPITKGIK